MKNSIIQFVLCIIFCVALSSENVVAAQLPTPGPDEVMIGQYTVTMLLGRILLVRKDKEICAVKFTKFWKGETDEDYFGKCEVYYQSDGSGDFSKSNVRLTTEDLLRPRARGFHPFVFQLGRKDLQCGSMILAWGGNGMVSFLSPGQRDLRDNGYELAPTPWTDISEVNAVDYRIRWYKLDKNRKDIIIPVSKLFDESK